MTAAVILFLVTLGLVPIFALDFTLYLGSCPKPTTIKNFDPLMFSGVWYDVKRYKNTVLKGDCGVGSYVWHADNTSYDFTYTNLENTVNLTLKDEKLSDGVLRIWRGDERLVLAFTVLDTDYDNYGVVWTCNEIVPYVLNTQILNIFSRKPSLDSEYLDTAMNAIISRNLDLKELKDVEQDNATCGRS